MRGALLFLYIVIVYRLNYHSNIFDQKHRDFTDTSGQLDSKNHYKVVINKFISDEEYHNVYQDVHHRHGHFYKLHSTK